MEKTNGVMSLLGLTASAGLANLPNIGQTVKTADDLNFSDSLKGATKANLAEQNTVQVAKKQTVVENSAKNPMNNIKDSKEADIQQKDMSLSDDEMEEVSEAVATVVNEIQEKIQVVFDKTEDEIKEAMEVLSLSSEDLFDAANMRSLVMELTETVDSIELITNTELYEGLMEVTELTENLLTEISNEFNIDKDSLKELLSTDSFKDVMENVSNEITNSEDEGNVISGEYFEFYSGRENEPVVKEDEVIKTNVEAPTQVATKDVQETVNKTEGKSVEVTVEIDNTEKPVIEKPVSETEMSQNNNSSNEQNTNKKNFFSEKINVNELSAGNSQIVTTQTVNTVGDIVETVTTYASYADTENVMRQVTDYVRVNISEDVTKMEMQLHPASLGTVNMQLNSQNGQVTAHLTVQNELVKSILESQMVKLQETFNEQGTKVTAIEVSVATYDLDAKNNDNYSQSENKGSRRGNSRRGINLNDLSSLDELTDEEQLQAEVMEMNGSSVNYTA